jgi:hypothetical protein
MRDVSCLQGIEELKNIEKYAIDYLNPEEKKFFQEMKGKVSAFIREERDDFLTFSETVKLRCIW